MNRTVCITGATSGIGYATAEELVKYGYRLIICGRRKDRLIQLSKDLGEENCKILSFDVSNKNEVFQAANSLSDSWKNIDILINNAGNAHGLASFQDAELDDLDAMIDSNVKGLIYVTRAFLPYLRQSKNAHIINISSIAGKQVYTNGTTYCASKWAVEALTKGMRLDFLSLGIKVTGIAPGAVNTEFSSVRFKGDHSLAENVYKGFEPLVAKDVADTILFVLNQPEHVQLADITILPKSQADGITIDRK